MKLVYFLLLSLISTITLSAKEYNLGKIDCNKTMTQYANFSDTFDKAFVGIPKGVLGIHEPFYGTLEEALKKMPNLKSFAKKLPTVVYMQGSSSFNKGAVYREWITGEGGFIFFAPNTHTVKNRPTYSSPVPKTYYEKVHAFRQAEIDQFIKRVHELPFIDTNKMFLMGHSEGALAAARYAGKEFVGRIVLSWSCEPGYYTDYPKVGAKPTDPFLNIIGRDDPYFGRQNPWNNAYHNDGHCGDALFNFTLAKVVLYPNTGHDIANNPYTKRELLSFIKMFKDLRERRQKEAKQAKAKAEAAKSK